MLLPKMALRYGSQIAFGHTFLVGVLRAVQRHVGINEGEESDGLITSNGEAASRFGSDGTDGDAKVEYRGTLARPEIAKEERLRWLVTVCVGALAGMFKA